VVEEVRRSEGCADSSEELPKSDGVRNRLWLLFEFPESSKAAFIIGIISVIITCSIILCCLVLFSFRYFFRNLFCSSAVYGNIMTEFFLCHI